MCPGGICHQSSVHLQLNSCLYSKIGQQAGRGAILGRELFQVYGYRKNGQFLLEIQRGAILDFYCWGAILDFTKYEVSLARGYFGFH